MYVYASLYKLRIEKISLIYIINLQHLLSKALVLVFLNPNLSQLHHCRPRRLSPLPVRA